MWIKQSIVERLIAERATATGKVEALERQVAATTAQAEWLMVRIGQLEHERAVLVERYMGVKLAIPTIRKAPSVADTLTADDLLNSMPSFEDMGDDAAAAEGIGWDEQGRVAYSKKA